MQLSGPPLAGQHEERASNKHTQRRGTLLARFVPKCPKYWGTRRQKSNLLTNTNNPGLTERTRFPGAGKRARGCPGGSAEATGDVMYLTGDEGRENCYRSRRPPTATRWWPQPAVPARGTRPLREPPPPGRAAGELSRLSLLRAPPARRSVARPPHRPPALRRGRRRAGAERPLPVTYQRWRHAREF